jgi:beta-glucanase (GH16 family)
MLMNFQINSTQMFGRTLRALLPLVIALQGCIHDQKTSATGAEPSLLPGGIPSGWSLVWADEFEVDGLPGVDNWVPDTARNSQGWYNDELQYYAANRPENSSISAGSLVIIARKEQLSSAADWGGQNYTSARLLTRDKAQWTFGFFEVRAKLPCGLGTWPAIWMLGLGGRWPLDGEIDIMEHSGPKQGVVMGTLHTNAYHGANGKSGQIQVNDVCENFHRYQMLWTKDRITFGVDDVNYHHYLKPNADYNEWPFDQPQYLILNVAVGGTLGGAVDDQIFPVQMEVDYVRVYQLKKIP